MRMRWLGTALLVLAGCNTPDPLKPPTHEEYILPPANDPRFSNPPVYPKEVLDTEQFKKDKPKPNDPSQGPPHFGAGGPGMGY
jgi:hypothetical protein